jgi:cytochrome c553
MLPFLPTLLRTLALAAAFNGPALAADAKPAFKPDAAKGQALAATCVACHLADGSRGAPANPILQGQHAEYLVKQLEEFKSGKRASAIMQGMVAALSPEDMKHLAAFYAGKQAKPGFAKDKKVFCWARRSTGAASSIARSPPARAATAPTVPASRPSTHGLAASMPTTPRPSWWPSGPARAPTARRCRPSRAR